jgi:Flp pilus assembly protein CpaB
MRPLSRWGSRVVRRAVPHSVRRRLRAPAVGSILALVVALATTGFTYQLLARAETGADRYGLPTQVAVATHDLAPGHVVVEGDVRITRLPRQAVPRSALADAPTGRALRTAVDDGQVLTTRAVAERGTSPIAAVLPHDMGAIAIPRGEHPLPLRQGDHVEVLLLDSHSGDAEPIADAASVLSVDDDVAVIAVEPDLVPDIAAATLAGSVALVLTN